MRRKSFLTIDYRTAGRHPYPVVAGRIQGSSRPLLLRGIQEVDGPFPVGAGGDVLAPRLAVPVTGVQALDPQGQRRGTVIARWKLIDNLGGSSTE